MLQFPFYPQLPYHTTYNPRNGLAYCVPEVKYIACIPSSCGGRAKITSFLFYENVTKHVLLDY